MADRPREGHDLPPASDASREAEHELSPRLNLNSEPLDAGGTQTQPSHSSSSHTARYHLAGQRQSRVALPKTTNFHDEWEPRFQPVAKCDFCSQRKLPILQSCTRCRMAICQACCALKHAEAPLRHAELDRVGAGDDQVSGKFRGWAAFAIEQGHILDPSTVSWKAPEHVKAPRTTRASRTRPAAASTSRREVSRRARGRPAMVRETLVAAATSRTEPRSPSFAAAVEAEMGHHETLLEDTENEDPAAEVLARPRRGVKRRASGCREPSPTAAAAQDAARILAAWSTSPPQPTRKRHESIHQTSADTYPQPPPNAPLSLPSLASLYPEWSVHEHTNCGSGLISTPLLQTRSREPRYLNPPGTYRNIHDVSATAREQAQDASPYTAALSRPHSGTAPAAFANGRLSRSTTRLSLTHEEAIPAVDHMSGFERNDHTNSPYGRPRPFHQQSTQPFPRSEQPGSEETSPSSDIQSLGSSLQRSALALQAAQPHIPLDRCLRHEIQRAWSLDRRWLSGGGGGTSNEQAFYALLAATYYACARLDLARHNAARDWLCENEQRLADMGLLVPVRLMPMASLLSGEDM